ncbi:MAG: biopolymer transporter ExbD [bacterium]|nr:biopolymer transporter ExbD [bacterium]
MQVVKVDKVQSAINVTPLVDVVLVLLIIFMVIAPQLAAGPEMQLPTTDAPTKEAENARRVLIALERGGRVWIDGDAMSAAQFSTKIRDEATTRSEEKVVIKGDARLSFGEVRRAMLAVNAAGFDDVGLIAERTAKE